jgi:hypothetical protein
MCNSLFGLTSAGFGSAKWRSFFLSDSFKSKCVNREVVPKPSSASFIKVSKLPLSI